MAWRPTFRCAPAFNSTTVLCILYSVPSVGWRLKEGWTLSASRPYHAWLQMHFGASDQSRLMGGEVGDGKANGPGRCAPTVFHALDRLHGIGTQHLDLSLCAKVCNAAVDVRLKRTEVWWQRNIAWRLIHAQKDPARDREPTQQPHRTAGPGPAVSCVAFHAANPMSWRPRGVLHSTRQSVSGKHTSRQLGWTTPSELIPNTSLQPRHQFAS